MEDFSQHAKFSVFSFQFSVRTRTTRTLDRSFQLSSLSFRLRMPSAKLQEPESLAKKSRTNPGHLQSHSELSEGRALWLDKPNPTGLRLRPSQHCRRLRQNRQGGACTISPGCDGFRQRA